MINIQKTTNGIITLSIDDRERETNTLNDRFLTHFETLVEEITRDDSIKGVVLTSSKNDFLLEHDLTSLSQMEDSLAIYRHMTKLQRSMEMLEAWGKPVVAAISGSIFGAGLEIALACHQRIMINHHSISLGLSSPKLGLIPGLGSIQRLSRLLGLRAATSLLMSPKIYHPDQAWEAGLVDALADTNTQMLEMAYAWIEQNPEVQQNWVRSVDEGPFNPKSKDTRAFFKSQSMRLYEQTRGFAIAQNKILERLHDGQLVPFTQACRNDALAFAELFSLLSSKNVIRTLYFGIEDCKNWAKHKSQDLSLQKRIGIIDPNISAKELILAFLHSGIEVVLKDQDITTGEAFKNQIAKSLQELVDLGKLNKEAKEFQLSLIEIFDDLEYLKSCDLIIDCIGSASASPEERAQLIEKIKKKNSPVATTALHSTLKELTIGLHAPQDWVGINFVSLTEGSDIIEIKKGPKSSGQCIKSCLKIIHEIDKVPIIINDQVDFFTDSLKSAYVNEALLSLSEGFDPHFIERAGLEAGMSISPLRLADIIGLERIFDTLNLIQRRKNLEKKENYENNAILKLLNQIKKISSKNDLRFYQATLDEGLQLSPAAMASSKAVTETAQNDPKVRSLLKDRLLYIQLTKSLELVEQRTLQSPIEADLSSILACHFPAHTGGVLSFIQYNGISATIDKYNQLESHFGERFCTPRILKQMASKKIDSPYELDQYFSLNRLEQGD